MDLNKLKKDLTDKGKVITEKGITKNARKSHVFEPDNPSKTKKGGQRKPRQKMDPKMVKDKVISFKVNTYQLEAMQKKLTIENNKVGLLARHYLEELTDIFEDE